MSKQKRWTKEEDLVLLSHVRNHPENISAAFTLTSREINRTYAAIQWHWTYILKKKVDVFSVNSDSTEVVNRKNIPYNPVADMSASELCTLLIAKLQAKKHCLENMIEGLQTFLKYKEEL